MIDNFHGEYRFLSNFYMTPIDYEGIVYPSTEHAFQAAKTFNHEMRVFISKLATSGQSKRQGRLVELREDWEQVKDNVMLNILRIKFSDQSLKRRLINTGLEPLIEGNTWHDNYWGSCECSKCGKHMGKNILGKLLMQVREELANENIR